MVTLGVHARESRVGGVSSCFSELTGRSGDVDGCGRRNGGGGTCGEFPEVVGSASARGPGFAGRESMDRFGYTGPIG